MVSSPVSTGTGSTGAGVSSTGSAGAGSAGVSSTGVSGAGVSSTGVSSTGVSSTGVSSTGSVVFSPGRVELSSGAVVLSTGVVVLSTGAVSLVELVELSTGVVVFPPSVELVLLPWFWLLQRLHEFWRMTLPNLVLIHSAIELSEPITSGLSTAKVAAPSPSWKEVMFPENSYTGTDPSRTYLELRSTSPSTPKKRLYHSMKLW